MVSIVTADFRGTCMVDVQHNLRHKYTDYECYLTKKSVIVDRVMFSVRRCLFKTNGRSLQKKGFRREDAVSLTSCIKRKSCIRKTLLL